MLFGIDVIITADNKHLVIDCNYFSSYNGIDPNELMAKFDSLFEEMKPKQFDWTHYGIGFCAALVIASFIYKRLK